MAIPVRLSSPSHRPARHPQGRWIGWGIPDCPGRPGWFCSWPRDIPDRATLFWQQVVNGLQLGFVYALIALGYTMVYGIVQLINFAHGDVFMVGAFVSYFAITRFQPAHVALAASFPV